MDLKPGQCPSEHPAFGFCMFSTDHEGFHFSGGRYDLNGLGYPTQMRWDNPILLANIRGEKK